MGYKSEEASAAIGELLKKYSNNRVFEKGVSVGCGNGLKEMKLIQKGIVKSFDLFELSNKRIEHGKNIAAKLNINNKVNFYNKDAFEMQEKEKYDIVHWNNSLHHMPNTYYAIKWSKNILKKEGYFYMDDYIGPNRFQWSNKILEVANDIRQILPDRFFRLDEETTIKREIKKPKWENMIKRDPSEAPDSENIIPSIKKFLPDAYVKKTGGAIYQVALNGLHANFKPKDKTILQLLLKMDDILIDLNESNYAIAIAKK